MTDVIDKNVVTFKARNKDKAHPPERMFSDNDNKFKSSYCNYEKGLYRHHYVVDKDLAYVECSNCNKHFNPMSVLHELASEESRWARYSNYYDNICEKQEQKTKCKCMHCGKFTSINVR